MCRSLSRGKITKQAQGVLCRKSHGALSSSWTFQFSFDHVNSKILLAPVEVVVRAGLRIRVPDQKYR